MFVSIHTTPPSLDEISLICYNFVMRIFLGERMKWKKKKFYENCEEQNFQQHMLQCSE